MKPSPLPSRLFGKPVSVPGPPPLLNSRFPLSGQPLSIASRLVQVEKWAEMTTREGPAGITKRQRVKTLLSGA